MLTLQRKKEKKEEINVEGGEDQMGKFPSKHFLPHLGRKQNTQNGEARMFSISPVPPTHPPNKGTIKNPPYFPLTFHPQNQPNQTGPKRLHTTLPGLDFS